MHNAVATAATNVATVTARVESAANADVAVAAMTAIATADAVAETATATAANRQRRVLRNHRAAMFSAAGATTKPRATLSLGHVRVAAIKAIVVVANGMAIAVKVIAGAAKAT
jgi:hypothetical protein